MDILQVCGILLLGIVIGLLIAILIGRHHAKSVVIAHIDPSELAERLTEKS